MNALLHNITMNNGWAMAVTGAIIVLCGLAGLATIISQLHRVIELFDKKHIPSSSSTGRAAKPADVPRILDPLSDLATTADIYRSLTFSLGDTFSLSSLYAFLNQEKAIHPHLTIRQLRESGYIVPAGDDLFSWKTE